ncbi:hypothetical protein OZX61_12255 (plasmid) [Acinetobacter sp. ESL0695]|uniref:hypothetical protein n=1 Tax=Acinetobacter sp. ESL0695 TaxID=2983215 RepID=UPI0023F528D0|nr:hypothetical protein [Acinetobacter sp. ESL0695]WEV50172.1 hypothetical protein OZX61_12255 [Acinetobacter sp. ESL0695]
MASFKMSNETYKNFLADVIKEILEKKIIISDEYENFNKGYNYALYEVVSLLVQQSENFGIDKKEIGLDGINPEMDYLHY